MKNKLILSIILIFVSASTMVFGHIKTTIAFNSSSHNYTLKITNLQDCRIFIQNYTVESSQVFYTLKNASGEVIHQDWISVKDSLDKTIMIGNYGEYVAKFNFSEKIKRYEGVKSIEIKCLIHYLSEEHDGWGNYSFVHEDEAQFFVK